jgi:hypothetical protein
MASTGALLPAVAHHADAEPDDCGAALTSALAAAEASLLAVCALANAATVAALPADGRALLRRVGALSAKLCAADDALATKQSGTSATDGGSESAEVECFEFSSLPHSLVVRVLAALPVDARLRCAEVCRTWLAAVCDRSLWLRVDLSAASGVTHDVTPALMRAVSARAAGHMQALVLPTLDSPLFVDAVLDVLRENSASLRELEMMDPDENETTFYMRAQVERMLYAAPQLQVLGTDVELRRADMTPPLREAVRMLRNEAPFGPLRMRELVVVNNQHGDNDQQAERVDDADLLTFFAAMPEHCSLQGAWLEDVPLDASAVLDALIDAALARRFSELDLMRCNLSPASIPAFVRLLGGGAMINLCINGGYQALLDAPAAALLADALRANTTLLKLQLDSVRLWDDIEAGVALITALTAHPSVRELCLMNNRVHADATAAVGAALGALVAANAPALRELYVSFSSLGDVGLAPLFAALPRNTHLRVLHCELNAISDAFARDRFLPAIRASTSLRKLDASAWWGGVEDGIAPDEVREAEAIVRSRADADAAASVAAA